MRLRLLLCVIGVGTLCSGCAPLWNTARTVVIEPAQYCVRAEDAKEKARNRKLAEAAWKEVQGHQCGKLASRDYADGFKDGYSDYLFAGGTGEPPAVPPRHYWKASYETPEGHAAIQDWFAGFRHGALEAYGSGRRQLITVPVSVGSVSTADRVDRVISGPPRVSGTEAELPHALPIHSTDPGPWKKSEEPPAALPKAKEIELPQPVSRDE